jgi:hypothetical protein
MPYDDLTPYLPCTNCEHRESAHVWENIETGVQIISACGVNGCKCTMYQESFECHL